MKALLLENINQSAYDYLTKNGVECTIIKTSLTEDDLIKKIKDIDILGVRSKTKITKRIINNAPLLKAIGCFCIGTNNVDLDYCRSKGIMVVNSPFMNTRSVAELVISEIIALSRMLGDKNNEMHRGTWNKSHVGCNEVRGKTLGIVGYGHVGSQVSVLAQNIGMNIIYYDILNVLSLGNAKKCDTLEELLKQSDFVSLHVPLTKETSNLISENEIYMMKKGSYLLNLSRGKVVDLNVLRYAINNGHIAGCAVDVYPNEPKSNTNDYGNVLQGCPNTILTPHIGGATEEAQYNIGTDASNKLYNYVTYGDSYGSVNFPSIQVSNDIHNTLYIKNIHMNVPGVMFKINSIFQQNNINIMKQYVATQDNIGYCVTIINLNKNIQSIVETISKLKESIKTSIFLHK